MWYNEHLIRSLQQSRESEVPEQKIQWRQKTLAVCDVFGTYSVVQGAVSLRRRRPRYQKWPLADA